MPVVAKRPNYYEKGISCLWESEFLYGTNIEIDKWKFEICGSRFEKNS
jgi:hypothetical protein